MKSRFLLSKATTGNKLDEHPTYKRTLFLLLIHSHFLPFEQRTSQVAVRLLHGVINQDSSVAIVLSTLAIATLVQPLRHRLQKSIDRHFYRRIYDAARIITTKTERVPIRALPLVQRGRRCVVGSLPLRLPANVLSGQRARTYSLLGSHHPVSGTSPRVPRILTTVHPVPLPLPQHALPPAGVQVRH